MSLALLTLAFLCTRPARADYPGGGYPGGGSWVPSDSSGNPLPPDPSGNNYLRPGVSQSDNHSTYDKIIPDNADDFWFAAYSPNSHSGDGSDPYSAPGLTLFSNANNWASCWPWGDFGTYKPLSQGDPREWPAGTTKPPDILGSVHGGNKGPLTAYFMWTGPDKVPDHASFLIQTSLGASADASYGNGGATSGVSATGTAKVEEFQEQVEATAGDAGSSSPVSLLGRHLKRVTPNGNIVTLSLKGEVTTDTSTSLAYSSWEDPPSPTEGTGYYGGPGNGRTSANASASVSATANYDARNVIILSSLGTTKHKGADGQPEANVRAKDGSLNDDSVVPDPAAPSNATYTAALEGSWAANSTYDWRSSIGSPGERAGNFGGLIYGFTMPGINTIDTFPVTYSNPPVTNAPGASMLDSVTIKLTDGWDFATATANYSVTFHDEVEQWYHDMSQDIIHPTPTVPTNDDYDSGDHGWHPVGPLTGEQSYKVSSDEKETDEIKIGGEVEAEIGLDEIIKASIKLNVDQSYGKEFSMGTEREIKATPPSEEDGMYMFYWGVGWEEQSGTVDVYGPNGFRGTYPWHLNRYQTDPSGMLAIRQVSVKWDTGEVH